MTKNAGRVLLLPKGIYDASITYDILDVVTHNNALWICKKPDTLGIEPTTENSDAWHLAITGEGPGSGADTNYLGGESAAEWQAKIDTVSEATTTNAESISDLQTGLSETQGNVSDLQTNLDTTNTNVSTNTENIDNIVNGITPAGNATNFGGLLPAEYVKRLSPHFTTDETILSWANSPSGVYNKFAASDCIPSDAPVQSEGFVLLFMDEIKTRKEVEFRVYSDDTSITAVYRRAISEGAWINEWCNVADGGNANTVGGQEASLYYSLKQATAMSEGDDFNNYTTFGNYVFPATIATSLVNGPYTDTGGVLRVERSANATADHLKQTVIHARGNGVYERYLIAGTWGEWDKVAKASEFLPLTGNTEMSGYVRFLNNIALAFGSVGGNSYTLRGDGTDLLLKNHSGITLAKVGYDGSETITGQLDVGTGYAFVNCDANHVNLGSRNVAADNSNYRRLQVLNTNVQSDVGESLKFQQITNGTISHSATVLHTLNSAKTRIQSSAPADTSALWVW